MPEENKINCERHILKRFLERMSVLGDFTEFLVFSIPLCES